MGGKSAVALLLSALLAGCLSESTGNPGQPEGLGDSSPVDGFAEPVAGRFEDVLTRSGGPVDVAALVWIPAHPTDQAVLLVHGFSGTKENYFHTLPEKGVSVGGRFAEAGYAVFAIDLPGYGESGGIRTHADFEAGSGIEDYAFVMNQLATHLRSATFTVTNHESHGFAKVAALGISMGGYIVDATQGLHGPFDAIIPIASSHRGLRSDAAVCFGQAVPLPECKAFAARLDDFYVQNADKDVINATLAGYERPHVSNLFSIAAWVGTCGNSLPVQTCTETPLNRMSKNIVAPVLSVMGTRDMLVDTSSPTTEPHFFPRSAKADVLALDDTGHMTLHHLNHANVMDEIIAWLQDAI